MLSLHNRTNYSLVKVIPIKRRIIQKSENTEKQKQKSESHEKIPGKT